MMKLLPFAVVLAFVAACPKGDAPKSAAPSVAPAPAPAPSAFDVQACKRGNLQRLMACDPTCSSLTGEAYDACAVKCVESRGGRVEDCNR